jgi:histidyl-tRNA synthetase
MATIEGKKELIEPRVLKGFRDTLPNLAIVRGEMIHKLEAVFASFGLVPIDTPALEYSEILLGKGSEETDKQLFRFRDQGDRDVAMRFDLTVPLARFISTHADALGLPFKRYHIAPVWRAEKPQRGRYREFIQCDFDILGADSALADVEVLSIASKALTALNASHRLRINNRKLLTGFIRGIKGDISVTAALRSIDKLDKLGRETVADELTTICGLNSDAIDRIIEFVGLGKSKGTIEEQVRFISALTSSSDEMGQGMMELTQTVSLLLQSGVPAANVSIDTSIARGLEYYTGLVFETEFTEMPEIGSICSGGRYDNLTGIYSKRVITGVGGSVGLDRLLAALEHFQRVSTKLSYASVMITNLDDEARPRVLSLASELRSKGINTEIYLKHGKLGDQLKYASKKRIRFAVILGKRELESGTCSVKDLEIGDQRDGVELGQVWTILK